MPDTLAPQPAADWPVETAAKRCPVFRHLVAGNASTPPPGAVIAEKIARIDALRIENEADFRPPFVRLALRKLNPPLRGWISAEPGTPPGRIARLLREGLIEHKHDRIDRYRATDAGKAVLRSAG